MGLTHRVKAALTEAVETLEEVAPPGAEAIIIGDRVIGTFNFTVAQAEHFRAVFGPVNFPGEFGWKVWDALAEAGVERVDHRDDDLVF